MSVRVATSAIARLRATLGPVLENSLNFVVPIKSRPMMIVPALVTSAENERASVTRIELAGLAGFKVLRVSPGQEKAEIGAGAEKYRDQEELDKR